MKRNCPICDSNRKEKIFSIKFAFNNDHPLGEQNDIVCCEACGFVFADNDLSQNDYNSYYANYNNYAEADSIKYTEDEEIFPVFYFGLLNGFLNKDDAIMDLGCGDGGLLRVLKKHGYNNVFGIDPSDKSIEKLKRNGVDGVCGNIFNINELNLPRFDVVISTGVLEHIYDIEGYVRNVISVVKDEGKIIVVVPAVEGFEIKYTDLPNYFNHEHINYFSKSSLDHLFSKMGLKEISGDSERLVTEPNGEYILYGIYSKKGYSKEEYEKDNISKRSVMNYYKKYSENRSKKDSIYKSLTKDKYVLWGTGSLATQFLAEVPEIRQKIKYCIDNNPIKHGTDFAGLRVCGADVLKKEKDELPIIICSMNNSEAIVDQIRKAGFKNECVIL